MKKGNKTAPFTALILVVLALALISGGCDAAKPKTRPADDSHSETSAVIEENTPTAKDAVPDNAVDASLKLDQTFEDQEYGFRFNYPSSCSLEKGEGILSAGRATLWFSKQKLDSEAILMIVDWMVEEQLSKTKSQISQETKKNGGSLKIFEKVKLDGKDCTHIKVAFGGMMDPRGSRISEQYFLIQKNGNGFTINFSGPANKFESYRPQFNAVLKSFKFDISKETGEQE